MGISSTSNEKKLSVEDLVRVFLRGHRHFVSPNLENLSMFLRFIGYKIGYSLIPDSRNTSLPTTLYSYNFHLLSSMLNISIYDLHLLLHKIQAESWTQD